MSRTNSYLRSRINKLKYYEVFLVPVYTDWVKGYMGFLPVICRIVILYRRSTIEKFIQLKHHVQTFGKHETLSC